MMKKRKNMKLHSILATAIAKRIGDEKRITRKTKKFRPFIAHSMCEVKEKK